MDVGGEPPVEVLGMMGVCLRGLGRRLGGGLRGGLRGGRRKRLVDFIVGDAGNCKMRKRGLLVSQVDKCMESRSCKVH